MAVLTDVKTAKIMTIEDDCKMTPDGDWKKLDITVMGKNEAEFLKNAEKSAYAKGWAKVVVTNADGVHEFMCCEKSMNGLNRKLFPSAKQLEGLAGRIAKKNAPKTMPDPVAK